MGLLVSARGSSVVATSGTTWATTANAWDGSVGVNSATYATWTNAATGAVGFLEVGGYNFSSLTGASDVVYSATIAVRHLESSPTTRFASVTVQAFDDVTAIGSPVSLTLGTAAATQTTNFSPTLAQLRSANFKIRVTATRGANTSSSVFSLDFADVTVISGVPVATPRNLVGLVVATQRAANW